MGPYRTRWGTDGPLKGPVVYPRTYPLPIPQDAQIVSELDGAGTAGRIPIWSGTKTLGDSVLIQTGSNVSMAGTFSALAGLSTNGTVSGNAGSFSTTVAAPYGNFSSQVTTPVGVFSTSLTSPVGSFTTSMSSPQGTFSTKVVSPWGDFSTKVTSPLGEFSTSVTTPLGSFTTRVNTPQVQTPEVTRLVGDRFTHSTQGSIPNYGLGWYTDSRNTAGPWATLSGFGGITLITAGVEQGYINPSGVLLIKRLYNYYPVETNTPFGLYFSNNGNSQYAIYRESGAWSAPYPSLRIAYHTGIKVGASTTYGGVRFYDNSDLATKIMSIGEGDSHVRVVNDLYVNTLFYTRRAITSVIAGGNPNLLSVPGLEGDLAFVTS